MSLNDREIRRSNRLAGIPPPDTQQQYVVQHTPTIPPMPDTLPPALTAPTLNPTSHNSSDLLSESIHTYGHPTVPMQQPNISSGPCIPPPNIQISSSSSSHHSNDAPFQTNDHHEYTPIRVNPLIQHIRGQNTIPNFISSYNVNSPQIPNQHHVPPNYPYQAPVMQYPNTHQMVNSTNNHHQMVQQFTAMQQQMQLNHQQQLRDLEQRFDQKLQQNTAVLSQSLATTLGDTIKQHLQHHDGATLKSDSSSINLIDINTPVHSSTTIPQKSVQFSTSNHQTSFPPHQVQHQHLPTAHQTYNSVQEDLASMLLAAKEPKLYFPSYKPAADYDNWKMLCVLKTSKHRLHSNLVRIDSEGRRGFDQSMSDDQSSTLFMLTMEALGMHADKLSIDMHQADGLALWRLLDRVNLNIDTDVTNQETLSHQFEALKQENNEDYEAFALRFSKKLNELKYNGVEVTTDPKRIAFKLL
jgi:hypothetical protein